MKDADLARERAGADGRGAQDGPTTRSVAGQAHTALPHEGAPRRAAADGPSPARPRAAADEVPSPCIDVCRMNARTGLCEGCLRTIDEIAAWGALDAAGKRAVLARIAERREEPSP